MMECAEIRYCGEGTYFQELMHLTGDTGGRQLMKQYEEKIRIVECAPEELKDIDRREDMTE